DPDVQLGLAARSGIPVECRGSRRDPARDDAAHERRCDMDPLSLPQEDQLVMAVLCSDLHDRPRDRESMMESSTMARAQLPPQAAERSGEEHSSRNDRAVRAGTPERGDRPESSVTVGDTRKVRTLEVNAAGENLSFYYGQHRALKNLTIPIADKQVTALIGPSGCGKSTFLRCFNRMHDLQ